MSYRISDCITNERWKSYKTNFLDNYGDSSKKALEADLAKIYSFLREHSNKNLHEINLEDIKNNLVYHIKKVDKPLQSRNAVLGYIGNLQRFFSHLHHKENIITNHVFIEKIWNVTEFVNEFSRQHNLMEEESQGAYKKEKVVELLHKINERLNSVTERQAKRLIQQSIYIQLVLITGMKMKSMLELRLSQFHEGKMFLEEFEIHLPKWTNGYINLYRGMCSDTQSYLFLKSNGNRYKGNELITLDGILGNIIDENEELREMVSKTLSSESLRATAISEMLRNDNNLYNILKISGLQQGIVDDFDPLYINTMGGEERWSRSVNENINTMIRGLSYFQELDKNIVRSGNLSINVSEH